MIAEPRTVGALIEALEALPRDARVLIAHETCQSAPAPTLFAADAIDRLDGAELAAHGIGPREPYVLL